MEKDCDDGKGLLWWKGVVMMEKDCYDEKDCDDVKAQKRA